LPAINQQSDQVERWRKNQVGENKIRVIKNEQNWRPTYFVYSMLSNKISQII